MYFFNDTEMNMEVVETGKVVRKIKAYGKEIMMVEVYFEKGSQGYIHTHSHSQTTYCLEGEFEFTIGDQVQVINTGDTIYMPPEISHGCKLLSEKGRLLDVFAPYREDFLN